jgi:hypothetical protein
LLLLTRNTRDFSNVPGLITEDWTMWVELKSGLTLLWSGRLELDAHQLTINSSLWSTNRQNSSIFEPATNGQEGGDPEVMEKLLYPI